MFCSPCFHRIIHTILCIYTGDELALKADSVKAFRETYSLSASGSQSIGGPSTPIVPTVVLLGTPRITSCGTVKLSGRQSQGGAGRDMVYTWSVSSTAGGDTSSLETVLAGIAFS